MEKRNGPDFKDVQKFYRLFRVPAAGHCLVPNAFPTLVNWVENGVAPEQIINQAGTRHASPLPVSADLDLQRLGRHECGG